MRTVFLVEGAIDGERARPRARRARGGAARPPARATASPTGDVEVERALDCRYVGQGYELRVPLADGRFDRAGARPVPRLPRARVRPRVRRPDRDRQPARHRDRPAAEARAPAGPSRGRSPEALIGESEARLRASTASWQALPTPPLRPRAGCRSTRRSPAPRSSSSRDTTIARPARLDGHGRRLRQPHPHEGGRR